MNCAPLLACLLVPVVAWPLPAQAQDWKTLATVRLLPGRDGESVTVRSNRQPYRQIRACTERRQVFLTELRINFTRGARQRISVQRPIRPGGCSRATRLRQQNASIRSIYVGHSRVRGGAPTLVRVQVR